MNMMKRILIAILLLVGLVSSGCVWYGGGGYGHGDGYGHYGYFHGYGYRENGDWDRGHYDSGPGSRH